VGQSLTGRYGVGVGSKLDASSGRRSGRASALLGVAGHRLALHRLLLCGSPTYLLLRGVCLSSVCRRVRRQVYHDSMKNDVPATHSLVLCMMCCPVGLLSHAATKAWVLRGGGAADEQAAGVGTGVAA